MLPTDFTKYIPKILKEQLSIDSAGQAFVNKINELFGDWKDETIEMLFLKSPERMPAQLLDEMNHYLSADFKPQDNQTVKRQKIYYAVQYHKWRTTWENDVKPRIDDITGKSASLWNYNEDDGWIMTGDGTTGTGTYWSSLGTDAIDTDLGIYLGTSQDSTISGVIFINCGWVAGDLPVTDILADLIIELEDHVPAYYKVVLGYEDVSGYFVELQVV